MIIENDSMSRLLIRGVHNCIHVILGNVYLKSLKHRRTAHGAVGLQPPPPRIFHKAIFGPKKIGDIRAKPFDFCASNGQKYSGKRLQPPERNSSRTPMLWNTCFSPQGSLVHRWLYRDSIPGHQLDRVERRWRYERKRFNLSSFSHIDRHYKPFNAFWIYPSLDIGHVVVCTLLYNII